LLDNSISFLLLWNRGPLTQEVEYLPFKQRVVGSSPARPTIFQFQNGECGLRNYFQIWFRNLQSAFHRFSLKKEMEVLKGFILFGSLDLFLIPNSTIHIPEYKRRSPSSSRPRTPAFHVGNRGSNPLGDAKEKG
jgi:hypothetical protein